MAKIISIQRKILLWLSGMIHIATGSVALVFERSRGAESALFGGSMAILLIGIGIHILAVIYCSLSEKVVHVERVAVSWPYVEVDEFRQTDGVYGGVYSSWRPGAYGPSGSSFVDARYIEFKYTVDGKSYANNKSTPDGGPPPMKLSDTKWRAYYKPSNPSISILNPIPYKGTAYLLAILFSGIIVFPHMFLTIPDWLKCRKKPFSSDSNET